MLDWEVVDEAADVTELVEVCKIELDEVDVVPLPDEEELEGEVELVEVRLEAVDALEV